VFSGKEYYSMLNHGDMEIAQTMEDGCSILG